MGIIQIWYQSQCCEKGNIILRNFWETSMPYIYKSTMESHFYSCSSKEMSMRKIIAL